MEAPAWSRRHVQLTVGPSGAILFSSATIHRPEGLAGQPSMHPFSWPLARFLTDPHGLGPLSRRQAIGLLELARHVALIGEAGVGGRSRERDSALDRASGERQPAHRSVPVGTSSEGPSEVAGDREAV